MVNLLLLRRHHLSIKLPRFNHVFDNQVILKPLDGCGLLLCLPLVRIGQLISILLLNIPWFFHKSHGHVSAAMSPHMDYFLLFNGPSFNNIFALLNGLGGVDDLDILTGMH
jgi:hypothetical protein